MFNIHSWYTVFQLRRLIRSKSKSRQEFQPQPGNFLYVPASCLPFHISGYTTRTHEILKNLQAACDKSGNRKLFVLTRTGYPWDRKDALSHPAKEDTFNILDGIRYDHLREPKNNSLTVFYAEAAAKEFEKYIIEHKISCVHAASNHVNALPALIAARRLGIPFQYEMRGLWELTRISRCPEFAKSHNFKLGLDLEAFVAVHADRVFAISNQLSLYIQKNWGVKAKNIALLPNCADIERIKPSDNVIVENDRDKEQKSDTVTIVYAGSLIVYEGIQTLLKAMSVLVYEKHKPVRLDILGDGEYRKNLEAMASELKLDSYVRFLGRVSPEEAKRRQDSCGLVCIPREPFEVCQIVPPIKMVEAMAKEKCVIVPDLPVFRDELGEGEPDSSGCIFFKSGDSEDLARVLEENIFDKEGLAEKGRRARQYVIKHRQWNQYAGEVLPLC